MFEYTGSALLGRSRVRHGILALLIDRPDERLHLREIARRVGTSAGTASRELARLVAVTVVSSRREGAQVYFWANTGSPLYEPVRDLVRRTIGAPATVGRLLRDVPGVEQAAIFGSYADGRFKADSDIDVLVVGSPDRDLLTDALETAAAELGRDVNEVVMSRVEMERRRTHHDALVESIDAGRAIEVPLR